MIPVAGDMNLDGIDDVGLWVKGRSGVLPRNTAETFMWLSDNVNANPALVFDSFSPDPLGNDLYLQYGDELALPVFGNFDPPTGDGGSGAIDVNPLHRTNSPLDVNGDGQVSPADALKVIDLLNKKLNLPYDDLPTVLTMVGGFKVDTSGDRRVSPIDALLVIDELNRRRNGSAEGESAELSQSDRVAALDSVFAQMGDLESELIAKRKRNS